MVLGKPVTTPFPRAPEGMAAGRPAASAAPSEVRAPGSLPAPRHPDVVRDPSLRWVLRRLRACTPGLACRTGTERRRRTVAPAAPGASRRPGQTRAVSCPRGGGALFSVRGVAAQLGGRTAEIGQVLPVQPGRRPPVPGGPAPGGACAAPARRRSAPVRSRLAPVGHPSASVRSHSSLVRSRSSLGRCRSGLGRRHSGPGRSLSALVRKHSTPAWGRCAPERRPSAPGRARSGGGRAGGYRVSIGCSMVKEGDRPDEASERGARTPGSPERVLVSREEQREVQRGKRKPDTRGGVTVRKDNKPKWEIERTVAYGKEAKALGQQYLKDLEPRLGAGLMDGFATDLIHLEAMQTDRPIKTDQVRGLTGSQEDIAAAGAQWAADIREAVRRRGNGAGLRRAVGVGRSIHSKSPKSVAEALGTILKAAGENPGDLRACGVLEADLAAGRELLASLGGASGVQDAGMVEKKDLTHEKDAIQRRVEAAIEAIATAGILQYRRANPALAQRFRGLIPPAIGTGGPASPGEDQPPATETAKN